MKAVDSNVGKKNETSLFTSWTLSFTAPTREEAQKVLSGYIQYISAIVVKETLENIRNQLEIKTRYEQEKLAMDRVRLRNQLDANIQRLRYSLEIANAAGIKKPVYSNGQAVKDDPDFSISSALMVFPANWKLRKGSRIWPRSTVICVTVNIMLNNWRQ
ncbi:ferric enterobactin transport protein FepE [Salmonella enterica subsp. arizonae]|uniref:Ferric enterobactin transport protein FepE n=1 Tax=Salmonella enterica subsp. arizonae TaxID=59203 RepID=A0A379SJK1_SALER|nr:ferric enterobactin transport protein FepE [Salmonella enterica subsp. arizonae]